MKKLIIICLLIATAFTINAQKKPSKEETVAYLDKILKMSIGYKTYGISGEPEKRSFEKLITEYSFNDTKIIETVYKKDYEDNSLETDIIEFSNMDWSNIKSIEKIESELSWDKEIILARVKFSSKIFYVDNYLRKQSKKDKIEIRDNVYLMVLKDKADNFKKALLRLSEITKEENKDPFGE
jgi:hypothetical protein